jgi:Fe2+ transport system protein B
MAFGYLRSSSVQVHALGDIECLSRGLGLPDSVGILLIFGIVRKELTILMLAVIFQTTNFASIMSLCS